MQKIDIKLHRLILDSLAPLVTTSGGVSFALLLVRTSRHHNQLSITLHQMPSPLVAAGFLTRSPVDSRVHSPGGE